MAADLFYHYTDFEALDGILRCAQLRVNNVLRMNDSADDVFGCGKLVPGLPVTYFDKAFLVTLKEMRIELNSLLALCIKSNSRYILVGIHQSDMER